MTVVRTVNPQNSGNGIDASMENMPAVKNFINKQHYVVGNTVQTPNNGTQDFKVDIGGSARWLYGINFFSADPLDLVTLLINNEVVLLTVPEAFYDTSYNYRGRFHYFELPRPLGGKDVVSLSITSSTSHQFSYAFYVSTKAPIILK